MVHEGTQITQTTEGQGSVDTLKNDEFEMPLVFFLIEKNKVTRKKSLKHHDLYFILMLT